MAEHFGDTEKNKLAQRIASSVERAPFLNGRFDLTRKKLPFYKNAYDVRIKCFTTRPVITKKYVCDDFSVFETDGEAETLSEINQAFSLTLNLKNVAAYTAFYFENVQIEDSFLRLVFKADDIIEDDFEYALQKKLKTTIKAPASCETSEGFAVSGCVLAGSTLFDVIINVSKNGEVSVNQKNPLIENLPVWRPMLR